MKKGNISTKIKIIGILFALLMSSIIATTIYLNNKNKAPTNFAKQGTGYILASVFIASSKTN